MDPNTRAATLAWINNQMAGDESLELWRKLAGVWSLLEAIPVASTPEQTHDLTLAPGTDYVFQFRARRNGGYRTGYESANPDDWPTSSRLAQTAGLPKPVLAFTSWQRTSSTVQTLRLTWTNVDAARATRLYRNAGSGFTLAATIAAGTSTYDYPIAGAEAATTLQFYVDQAPDSGSSNPADTISVYAGPVKPDSLATNPPSGYINNWYGYSITFGNPQVGASTRIQDDYCGAYQNRSLTGAGVVSKVETGLHKNSAAPPNGNIGVNVNVRVRAELTSFTVTDVSEWTGPIVVPVDIAADETAYGSC